MAVHPCPRCGKFIPTGVTYCEQCRPVAEAQAAEAMERKRTYKQRQYNSTYNKRRDPKYLTFYRSSAWKTMSKAYLQSVGYKCEAKLESCTKLAVEVHHIKAIQTEDGWIDRLTWGNLQAVCTSCHNNIHQRWKNKHSEPGVIDIKTLNLNK